MVVQNFDKDIYLSIQNTYLKFFQENSPVRSGQMKREWNIEKENDYTWIITNSTPQAVFLEYGTGIYGPKHRYITPVNKKALRWFINNKPVFSKRVKGIKPLLLTAKAKSSTKLKKEFEKELKDRLLDFLL